MIIIVFGNRENLENKYANPDEIKSNMNISDAGEHRNLKGPHVGETREAAIPIAGAVLYSTTFYIYSFDGRLLAEYDGAGTCQKDYIYMGGKLIAEYQPVTSKYYYYTSDQINSTRIVTDSAGAIVSSSLYDPYGGVQKVWVDTYHPKLGFSGKERESSSELDYFGARYYGHRQYRFLSVDPVINKDKALSNPQYWNLYAYCGNNPITFFDSDGRDFIYPSGSSDMFKAGIGKILSFYEYGKNQQAKDMIQQADKLHITLIEWPLTSVYLNGKIWFDPYSGLKIDSKNINSAAISFIHELAHAIRDLTNSPPGYQTDLIPDEGNPYTNAEEQRVITKITNPIAKSLKQPTRKSYSGTRVKVDDPTYFKKDGK